MSGVKEALPDMAAPLTIEEVNYADQLLWRATQKLHIPEELLALPNDQKLPKGSVL